MSLYKIKPLAVMISSVLTFSPLVHATELDEYMNVNSGEVVNDITIINGGTLNVEKDGLSYNTVIELGGSEYIDGGRSESATVKSGGAQWVAATSAVANNTVIEHGGRQWLRYGGTATNTVLSGDQWIEIDGSAIGTIILEGGFQYIEGSDARAENTIVKSGGLQRIISGATAVNTVIEGDALQDVKGSTATNTTIKSGGVQNVTTTDNGMGGMVSNGMANNTVIESGGLQILNPGAIATNTVISGGTQTVADGRATGTIILKGGVQYIEGSDARAEDTTVKSGASQSVTTGATAKNTVIEGDAMQSVHGGTATDTTIKSGGVQKVTGTENGMGGIASNAVANNTMIESGGLQLLNQGAIATNTVISGGYQNIGVDGRSTGAIILDGGSQYISAGGSAEDTIVKSGEQLIYGTTTGTTINGGLSTVFNGGVADGKSEINAGGEMRMHAGSKATDVHINDGTITVNAITESTAANAARIDALVMNGGNVAFEAGKGDRYASLNIGELSGKGNFLFNTSLADRASNFVTIAQGSGSFGVAVSDTGKEIADHTDLTVNLISDRGGDIDFTLMSARGDSIRAVDGGAYMYVLKQEIGKDGLDGNVWHLGAMTDDENGGGDNGNSSGNGNSGGKLVTTPSTDAVLSLANAGLNIMRGEMDGLRSARQSQSSDRQQREGSIWGHYLGKKSAAETSNGAAYKLYQNGMELGGDVVTALDNGLMVTGGFVSLTGNNVKHARGGTSSIDSYGLGVYATWYDNSGLYLDGTLKANLLESQLSARMTNGAMTQGKWHQYGLSATLEAGYTFTPMESLTVEPFTRITGTTINDANVKLNNGMSARTGKARSLLAEAGSRLATDFSLGRTAFHPYLSVSAEQEFAHSNEAEINNVNRFKNHQNGTSGKYGAGLTVSPAKDVTLYGELNYRQGSYVEEPLQGMAGVRISF
ncbi:autotransporter outer membrane beta-barrel domain-containing protein [Cronobacter dublinensis]|uniref:autotransporter outer membrane beta-barrel domain-containing protein n=1 Tax=Cronobacter dublinensis TaxID=413497 RepID=UPI0024AFCDFB|nr:autotransporter outer membrane beta-barrel domain-containing protein [Cronobacter dublinensis]MDI7383111.1 autotransporter outer membrane beta-barrel domain-containing protein [Cronobacter dublinensis]